MEITIEEIQKKFESLPEDLKWAIIAAKVDDRIIEIGQANALNVEQMGQLSLETHMVMFGFTHLDKFEESLQRNLKLQEGVLKTVVNDVNEKILKSIRQKLMDYYSEREENTEKTPEQAPVVKDISSYSAPKQEIQNEHKNNDILKQAGIEIMPPEIEGVKASSFAAAKFAEPFKIPAAKTEYTLNNISKASDAVDTNKPASTPSTPPATPSEALKATPTPSIPSSTPPEKRVDPYRLPIE